MPTLSEDRLASWTQPAFGNEQERADYTEQTIRSAIKEHPLLKTLRLKVFAKGSYKNNTNVRRDSDVDVAVQYQGIVFTDYDTDADTVEIDRAHGLTPYNGPLAISSNGDMDIPRFKGAIHAALRGAFSDAAVTRHNKVFTVRESNRSLAADVVPCATYRYYWGKGSWQQHEGIRLLPDQVTHPVNNYPEQQYTNGVNKNAQSSRRFKSVVRILKNLENQMVQDRAITPIPGYLVECLTYQAPLSCFSANSWADQVRGVLAHVWTATEDPACESELVEINGIKYLFHAWQKWNREDARNFVYQAWQYVADS